MIDVSAKFPTLRRATAHAQLAVQPTTITRVIANDLPKKDPLTVARWAGIQAAKRTSELIPACHPVPLDWIDLECTCLPAEHAIQVRATAVATYQTGVEMEALVAATIAALTLYDMLKPIDDQMSIREVCLVEKSGGIRGAQEKISGSATVITVSDSVAAGTREDRSGPVARAALEELGFMCDPVLVVPDEINAIATAVRAACDKGADLVITCGGTGLGPRDVTPAALRTVFEREAPGLAEWIRAYGRQRTPFAVLSNAVAGLRGRALVIALPGSPRAVSEAFAALAPVLPHALAMIHGGGHEPAAHD